MRAESEIIILVVQQLRKPRLLPWLLRKTHQFLPLKPFMMLFCKCLKPVIKCNFYSVTVLLDWYFYYDCAV